MRKNLMIEKSIATVLTDSRLPMARRAEVAEELRDHLSQLVEDKCTEGMSEVSAVEAALADFGSLDEIRRQLRKQQGVLDRKQVVAKLRWFIWPAIVGSGVVASLIAIFAPPPASVSLRCLFGACIFFAICGMLLAYGGSAELLVLRLQRPRPKSEYHFKKSFCYWTIAVSTFFIFIVSVTPLALIVFGYLGQYAFLHSSLNLSPQLQADAHWLLLHSLVAGAMDNPLRSFLLPCVSVIAGAWGIAIYERSLCVDDDYVADTAIVE